MLFVLPALAAIFIFAMNKNIANIKKIDILLIVFVRDYILFTSMGYIYYSSEEKFSNHYILQNLSGVDVIYISAIAAFYFICFFSIFYYIFKSISLWLSYNIKWDFPKRYYLGLLLIFTVICGSVLIFFMFYYKASLVGLSVGMSAQEVSEARSILSQSGGGLRFLKLITTAWIPMASFVWFYIWCASRRQLSWLQNLVVVFSIACGCLAAIWSFEKSRLAFYMLGLAGVWLYAGRDIRIRTWLILASAALLFVAIGYLATYGDKVTDFQYLVNIIEHRLMSQSVGAIVAFDLYPDTLPFKGIAGISNYLASLLGETFSSPYGDIIDYMVPETSDISGAMSSFATGEAYALFGVVGVIVSPVVAAFYFGLISGTQYAGSARIFWVPLYASFFSVPYLASSFYSFFWPVGILLSMAPFIFMVMLAELLKRAVK